jgi:hypothetical protein
VRDAGMAIVRQRGGRAAAVLVLATPSLLGQRPTTLPVRPTGVAIVGEGAWDRHCVRRAPEVGMAAAPCLLTD